jgi:hypothetical protein
MSKNNQQESARPIGQETKRVSTCDINQSPCFGDGATRVGMLRVLILE